MDAGSPARLVLHTGTALIFAVAGDTMLTVPSPHPRLNDPEWLRTEYLERRRTGEDLAAELGVHRSSVERALERHGIRKNHRTLAAVPTEWLREQHVERGRTLRDLADEIDVTPTSIRRALARAGIPVNNGRLPAQLDDPTWLAEQAHLSSVQLARDLGVTAQAIARARRRHGLGQVRPSPFPLLDDPSWLRARYHDDGWTQRRIADELGCSRVAVANAMKRLGIEARPPQVPMYAQLQNRHWLDEQVQAGRSPAQIAAEVGCHRSTVVEALRRLGLR